MARCDLRRALVCGALSASWKAWLALASAGETAQTAAAMKEPERQLECREGCGACCIAPSISPFPPALPMGKPAGERCPHLTSEIRCALFGTHLRPPVCSSLRPQAEMCGGSASEAMATIIRWETLTAPRR